MANTLKTVTDSVVEFGESAARTIDQARDQTSGALHAVASSVREGSARIDDLASGTARRLDATARLVKHADFKGVFSGARRFGQNHMTVTLVVAAAVGVWAGLTLGRVARSS